MTVTDQQLQTALDPLENYRSGYRCAACHSDQTTHSVFTGAPRLQGEVDRSQLGEVLQEAVDRWADMYPTPQLVGLLTEAVAQWLEGVEQ